MIIPETVKAKLRDRREENERRLSERYDRLRRLTPEIDDIEMKKRMVMFEHGQKAFSLSETEYEADKQRAIRERDALDARKAEILRELGFPADFLELHYTCDKCKDSGTLTDGTRCSCLRELILDYCYENALIDKHQTFETFDLSVFRDEKQRRLMSKVHDYVLAYAEALPHPEPIDLMLIGSTGLGKSFILNCIAHRAFEMGLDAVKITSYSMIESIMKSFRNDWDLPDYVSCDLLAIDDLGTEAMVKNVTVERIFAIINERQTRNKPTIIATNLSKTDLFERYGERVASRLLSPRYGSLINLSGDDVRLK